VPPDVSIPDSVQGLLVIIAFFMPGFIAGKVFELCFPRGEVPERVRLLEYVALSCVNYAVCSWIIVIVVLGQWWYTHQVWFTLCTVVTFLVAPLLVGFGFAIATERQWFQWLARRVGIQAPHHIRTAWDWFFRKYPKSRWWVVIRLRSGIIV